MDYRVFSPSKIYVDKSPIHGWGVFAKETINEGEIFEECVLLTIPMSHGTTSDFLLDYRFNWPQGDTWEEQVCALGFGSLYNHSDTPNAYWRSYFDKKTFEFVSYREILPGEEIFVWYGGSNYWNDGRNHIVVV
jgi:SET domain-containing protein